ncbi:MAG: cupin-like domain-containing protein [Chitinophagales bacterium]|nr:cupin-like domain-containing protein [Chitinophagales bacterium]
MKLLPIERVSNISPKTFKEEFQRKNKPCVFTDFTKGWPAVEKWNYDFFHDRYGHLLVPVYSSNYSKPGKGYMTNDTVMRFGEFLEKIRSGPTDLRLFLFDIFEHAPELKQDFTFPDYQFFWIKVPFMFFGGESAEVTMHYDIDCANVFLTQFVGNKHVILFPPEESEKIYHHPFTVKSLIDPRHPDYEKFPALKHVTGYETVLKHGETLFMPSRYWHYMHYLDFSFGLALRSQNSPFTAARGSLNIATHFVIDKGLNRLMGKSWHDWKERKAYERARPYEA